MKPKQMVMYGILSFLAASVLALYVYFFGRLDEQSPNETVQTYMLSLRNQDYEQLYDLMSTESLEQSDMSREQFIQKYKSIFEGMGVTNIEVNAGTPIKLEDSSNYMLDYSAVLNTWIGQIHEKYQLILIQEKSAKGNPWKIQWMPSLILPDMATGDKVSVKVLKPERGEITDRDGYALATKGTPMNGESHPRNWARILIQLSGKSVTIFKYPQMQ